MSSFSGVRVPVEIQNASGDALIGDLRYYPSERTAPIIIVCHSFMAFKDWGFFPYVAESFAGKGFAALTFNFSRNGVGEDPNRITDLKKFEANTFSQELEDLSAVIGAVEQGSLDGPGLRGRRKIVLLGHSRGGGIAILAAATDDRIDALVTWSAVATLDRWTDHQKDRWRLAGSLPLSKDTAASPLRLGLALLDDFERNRRKFDIPAAAGKVRVPWFLLHGTGDLMVPPREAETLFAAAHHASTKFVLLERAGHLYNAASVSGDGYRTLDGIIDSTTQWLFHQLTEDHA